MPLEMTIRRASAFLMFTICVVAPSSAEDLHPGDVNAALRAHDRMVQMHRSSGAFPGGYRPFSAYTYTQAAALHADALNSYRDVAELPPEVAQEHLAEISRNVEASSKEMKKLDPEVAKSSPVVQGLTKAIQSHYEAAQQSAKSAQEEISNSGKVVIAGSPHYATISYHLNSAAAAHHQMLKALGIGAHGER